MPTHVHLLLETNAKPLSGFGQRLRFGDEEFGRKLKRAEEGLFEGRKKRFDGFVKSPSAALRCNPALLDNNPAPGIRREGTYCLKSKNPTAKYLTG